MEISHGWRAPSSDHAAHADVSARCDGYARHVISRLLQGIRVYYGFAREPEAEVRDDFGRGGIISGGAIAMGVGTIAGVDSFGAGVAVLVAGSVIGWSIVRGGRALVGKHAGS
jgi:hypothetical protein